MVAGIGLLIVPFNLPLIPWLILILILIIMLANTALTTLSDSIASDTANQSSVHSVMTTYAIATDLGSAIGPILIYMVISLEYGLFYSYIGGAVIFFFLMLLWSSKNDRDNSIDCNFV